MRTWAYWPTWYAVPAEGFSLEVQLPVSVVGWMTAEEIIRDGERQAELLASRKASCDA